MVKVPFFSHDLGEPEIEAVRRVFNGTILTTGDFVQEFEERFAAYLGLQFTIGVTSCTGAMHIALLASGVEPQEEVITTPMTFIATATAIIQSGAIPVFVDIEDDTGNIDANKISDAIGPKTKAILPVHLYGQMCDMRTIHSLAERYQLAVIEDAAHCIEGERDGVRPGGLSNAACFSFYATKNLTCGEGGAAVTNAERMNTEMRLLRHHGMTKTANDRFKEGYQHWDMVKMGWKYNMDNIQAAMLLPQLDRLERNYEKRKALSQRYCALLSQVPYVSTIALRPNTHHAWHLFPIRIQNISRDLVVQKLNAAGIQTVVNYRAIHLLTYFRERFGFKPGDFPIAEKFGDSVLSLPFYPNMPLSSVDLVVEKLDKVIRECM